VTKITIYVASNHTRQLLRRLRYMPLAIELANIYFKRTGKSLSEFASILSSVSEHFLRFEARVADMAYENPEKRSIFRLLEMNLRDLTTEKVGSFLPLLGFFDASLINLSLIIQVVCAVEKTSSTRNRQKDVVDRLYVWGLFFSSPDFDLAVGSLVELSFVRRSTSNACKVLVVHPLVHQWARYRLEKNQYLQFCLDTATILSLALSNGNRKLIAGLELCSHVHFLLARFYELDFTEISAAAGLETFVFIIHQFAQMLHTEWLLSEACQLYELVFECEVLRSTEPDTTSTPLLRAMEDYGRLLW